MLKNYLRIAFRSLSKNKGYSILNIVGLAIGYLEGTRPLSQALSNRTPFVHNRTPELFFI